MLSPALSAPAVAGVLTLVVFLSYSSQYLFAHIAPGLLNFRQSLVFNVLNASLLICYARACLTDPGSTSSLVDTGKESSRRWCRKCEQPKPPRAHHCKVCKRCILKMDHHCPWTINCVSHRTFPHFIRFLFYAVAAMIKLEEFLFERVTELWANRYMPHYLGPSKLRLAHLLLLVLVNSFTLFMLAILLIRSLWCLAVNTTTIEGWEIERHHALLRRAKINGGFVYGPNGIELRIRRQEFPYDIGIWRNIVQGMGSSNPISWLNPLASSPSALSGTDFQVNDFEGSERSWPPPDPDRLPFRAPKPNFNAFMPENDVQESDADRITSFKHRQRNDYQRRAMNSGDSLRRRDADKPADLVSHSDEGEAIDASIAEERWTNKEGETLEDFGIDEEADFGDDDDIPLNQLLAKQRQLNKSE